MRILLLEDDCIIAERLEHEFVSAFPGCSITHIQTELSFIQFLPSLRENPPDICLLDLMVPFASPSDKTTYEALSADQGAFHLAGLRCWRMLQDLPQTARIPAIIHSIVDSLRVRALFDDPPLTLHFVSKEEPLEKLFTLMRSLVPAVRSRRRKTASLAERVVDATELKPGAFGVKVDIKKLLRRKT